MEEKSFFEKYFKSSEEVISMFLGLVIVLVMVGMVVNYFQKRRGSVAIPGLVDNKVAQVDRQNEVESPMATVTPGSVYKVKANDSLWKIAVATYGDGFAWTKIAKENNLKNPGVLVKGQQLKLPVLEAKAIVTDKTNEVVKPMADSYKVARGDSLWKIAVAKYNNGYAWTKIYANNKTKLHNPNELEIGMVLNLPSTK
jgi:nucleoid-associated protein YgaU